MSSRAGFACEYCHLPILGQVAQFPLDHIAPLSQEGPTDSANLAFTYPHCNSRKWLFTEGMDPQNGKTVPLFNPRTQNWHEHFAWSTDGTWILVGVSSCGRATVNRLKMNEPLLLAARSLLAKLGIFPEARP